MNNFWLHLNKPILALAPMAGISDSAFRQMCKNYGADVVYTEMISADGLYYDSKKTLELLKFNQTEKPVVVQLFGKRPEVFVKAAQICQAQGFDGIDINFGCPARKVVAHGGGVTLMRDLDNSRRIIQGVLSGTTLPVSVKIRAGIDQVTALDFVAKMADLPIATLMIHGRYFQDPFSGPIDYEIIKQVKAAFSGVVLGNGGINTPEQAEEMINKTKVDGLGLARGLYGKPWLFNQIKDLFSLGQYQELNTIQIKQLILEHAELAFRAKSEHGLVEIRKHLLWYVAGWPGAKDLRQKLVQVKNINDIKKILNF